MGFELEVVLLGRALRGAAPGEPVEHAAAPAFTELAALVGVVECLQELAGQRVGTVTASRPPGRSTRTTSTSARSSSQMCSSTSDTITRSNPSSGNGRSSASALTTPAQSARLAWPASIIAPATAATSLRSAAE